MEECKLNDECDVGGGDHNHLYGHIERMELNIKDIKVTKLDIVLVHIKVMHIEFMDIKFKHIIAENIKVIHIEVDHTEVIHIEVDHTEVIHIELKAKHNFNFGILKEDILTIDRLELRNIIQGDIKVAVVVDINLVDN
jgi:hypothetical protein